MDEASMKETPEGLVPQGEGWFVLNIAKAAWRRHPKFGADCRFEGEPRFAELGVNVHVLWPGQPACRYHAEGVQEDFFVLSGEGLVVIEGQERPVTAGDFIHCPPGTRHVFVGAGAGPCAILMMGVRKEPDPGLVYPVDPVATRHGAGVSEETRDPAVAYAADGRSSPCRAIWPLREDTPRP